MAIKYTRNVLKNLSEIDNNSSTFDLIKKYINMPLVKPVYRISILNPDETVNYTIPDTDIPEGGISYTEEYQNGQRRNITLELINTNKKYTPSINGIWLDTKFLFEVGIIIKQDIYWFSKGIYIMGDVNLTDNDSEKTVSIQLKDKYAIFDGKMGTLESAYEVEVGSNIEDALKGIFNFPTGSGYILDYKDIILDTSFIGFKTKSTIRVEEGGTLSQVIEQLATQLSAEYYYNNNGNFCMYPINETIDDSNKPIIWTFSKIDRSLQNFSANYKNEEVINVVKVVGDNIENGIFSAVVTNDNPSSPICIQRIGRRIAPKYSEPNIWNDELANDLAKYYLRQASFIGVDFSTTVGFNPLLTVNNICEVENDTMNLSREKLLLTSISFSSSDGLMSLNLCSTKDLPFIG